MENFWYTFNSLISTLSLYAFLLIYSHCTMGKPRKWFVPGTAAAITVISLTASLVPWMLYGNAAAWIFQNYRHAYSLIQWGVFLLYYLLSYPRESIGLRILHAIISFILLCIGDVLTVFCLRGLELLFGTPFTTMLLSNDRWGKWYGMLLSLPVVLFYAAIYLLLKRFYPRMRSQLHLSKTFGLLIFPIAQFFAIFTLIMILQQFSDVITSPTVLILLSITILLNVISNVVLLYFMKRMHLKEQEEQKIRFFEEYEVLSMHYQEQAAQASQDIAKLRHDFNNQMQVFSGLMQADAISDAMLLAEELQTKFHDQKLKLQYCGNPIVNVILQQTAETCAKEHIPFEVHCTMPEETGIRKVDLCSLLINPLQNAVQASEQLPEAERSISCNIWQEGSMLFLRVRNRKQNSIQTKDGKLQTTKANKAKHGFGIEIMEHIAGTYGGNVSATYDEDSFCVVVQLNLPENTSKITSESEAAAV